jgi:tetratricopeptide (TPR) repeat protein
MSRRLLIWLWLAGVCVARPVAAADGDGTPAVHSTKHAYEAAKARYQTNNNDDAIAQQFAIACFDWGDQTSQESVRATVAREGIDACRRWLQRSPNQAAAHYYLGMNQAQLARTKSLGALPLVRDMEKEWLAALALDPHVDFAGPDRNLGLLYRDTPGFPVSVGSRTKAEHHIEHAIELDPEYPENHLNRIETHLKRKPSAVADEFQKLRAILPAARKQFSGPQWEDSWADWDSRIKKIQAKLPSSP